MFNKIKILEKYNYKVNINLLLLLILYKID